MTTYYVNKSGDNGNDGLTEGTAWKSLKGAHDNAGNDDIVIVQSGVYRQSDAGESWGTPNMIKTIDWRADGLVIVDGEDTATNFYRMANTSTGTFNGFFFRNFLDWVLKGVNVTGAGTIAQTIANNFFYLCGGALQKSITVDFPMNFTRNVVAQCTSGVEIERPTGDYLRNTFYSILANPALVLNNITPAGVIRDNIFHTVAKALSMPNSIPLLLDYNDYFTISGDFADIGGSPHADLISLQGASYETNGKTIDPQLGDPTRNLFLMDFDSALADAGSDGGPMGARGLGTSISPTATTTAGQNAWTGAILTGVALTPNDNIELTIPPEGTWESDVIDLGRDRSIGTINFSAFENYPAEVIDQDKTDVEPNRRQLEIRGSSSSFLKGDGSPIYQVVEFGKSFPTPLTARYVQIKVTMRTDGVEA